MHIYTYKMYVQQQSKHVLVLKLLFQILSREGFVKACWVSWIPMTCYIHIYIITSCELDSYYMLYIYTSHLSGWIPMTHYIYIITPCRFYSYNVIYIYHILQTEHNGTSSECLNTVSHRHCQYTIPHWNRSGCYY